MPDSTAMDALVCAFDAGDVETLNAAAGRLGVAFTSASLEQLRESLATSNRRVAEHRRKLSIDDLLTAIGDAANNESGVSVIDTKEGAFLELDASPC